MSDLNHDLDEFADMLHSPRQGVAAEKVNPQDAAKAIKRNKIQKSAAQIKQIKTSIKNIFLFDSLSNDQTKEMIDYMFSKPVKNKEVIITEKDPGDNFYVIEKGIFEAFKKDKMLKHYDNIGYFGELSLMYNTPRNATVKALSDGLLWGLDRDSFRRIVLQHAYERRNKFEDIVKRLSIMKALSNADRSLLLDSLSCQVFKDVLFKEGLKNERFYIVESGEVEICKTVNGKEVKKILKSGEYFGEECIIFNRPSSFTAKCVTECTLGFIDKESLTLIIDPILGNLKTDCDNFIKSLK